ncbi:uncharacterized protein LOC125034655 [Penaeus chinensis]|uniref:uncharacterized protein LOC125034655 n=1 Tax=Penaeus chinensis TaxID=139456 RepID=UPI001FB6114A|nr:uncharacterized protein LOC125034655 [Penaeus chinensis]
MDIEHDVQRVGCSQENAITTSTRDQHRGIKDLIKTFKPTIDTIKDENGNALCNGENVKERWKTYCEDLYKVNDNLNNIVLDQSRLKVKLDEEIADEQCGLRANKGTRDQILNLKLIMKKHRERYHNLCSIDYRKKAVVRTTYGLTDSFNIGQGVCQGCILSSHLFNVYSEKIMRDALDGFEGTIKVGGRNVTNLRYADDIVLIAGSMLELEDLITRVKLASEQAGLMLNTQKTKVMKMAGDPENIEMRDLTVNGEIIETVEDFIYLDANFTNDCNDSKDIRRRLAIA